MPTILVAFLAALLGGCGASSTSEPAREDPAASAVAIDPGLAEYGVSLDLPSGWEFRALPGVFQTASFPLPEQDTRFRERASGRMTADDVLIALYERDPTADWAAPEQYPETRGAVAIAARDFAPPGSDYRLGTPASHAVVFRSFSLAGR